MSPSLRFLVLVVSVDRDDDGFDDAVRAMREIGLVGAAMGDTEERPPDATLAFLACDDHGCPLVSIRDELVATGRTTVVHDLARRVGGSVRLYEDGDEHVTAVEVEPRGAWVAAPARWAWWIASRGARGDGFAVQRALGSGSVELALGGRRLVVGSSTTYPSWSRQVLPAIGVVEDSTMLAIHVHARAGDPVLSLVWWRGPLPLVEEPAPAVLHAQSEIVAHMGAGAGHRDPEADIRRAMAAVGRSEHADAMLALLDEWLEADTGARALALLGVPDALMLALRGEVDVARLPGARRY